MTKIILELIIQTMAIWIMFLLIIGSEESKDSTKKMVYIGLALVVAITLIKVRL